MTIIDKIFIGRAVKNRQNDEEIWRTTENGQHYKLETETGEIKAGMGGKMNGVKVDPSKAKESGGAKKPSTTGSKLPPNPFAERANRVDYPRNAQSLGWSTSEPTMPLYNMNPPDPPKEATTEQKIKYYQDNINKLKENIEKFDTEYAKLEKELLGFSKPTMSANEAMEKLDEAEDKSREANRALEIVQRKLKAAQSEPESQPASRPASQSTSGNLEEYEFRLKYKNAGDNAYRTLQQLTGAKERYQADIDKWVEKDLFAIGKTARERLMHEIGGDPSSKEGKEKLAEWVKKRHPTETRKHEVEIRKLERAHQESTAELEKLMAESRNRPAVQKPAAVKRDTEKSLDEIINTRGREERKAQVPNLKNTLDSMQEGSTISCTYNRGVRGDYVKNADGSWTYKNQGFPNESEPSKRSLSANEMAEEILGTRYDDTKALEIAVRKDGSKPARQFNANTDAKELETLLPKASKYLDKNSIDKASDILESIPVGTYINLETRKGTHAFKKTDEGTWRNANNAWPLEYGSTEVVSQLNSPAAYSDGFKITFGKKDKWNYSV